MSSLSVWTVRDFSLSIRAGKEIARESSVATLLFMETSPDAYATITTVYSIEPLVIVRRVRARKGIAVATVSRMGQRSPGPADELVESIEKPRESFTMFFAEDVTRTIGIETGATGHAHPDLFSRVRNPDQPGLTTSPNPKDGVVGFEA